VPARLADVAKRAGVSVKTVSNVVNGYVHVSAATRARVEAAIEELDYRPNLAARNLRSGHSGIIALAVPELSVPYFTELAAHVLRAAERRGLTVLIDETEGRPDRERLVLEGIRRQLIDGLIFSPLGLGPRAIATRRSQTPLVLLGERVSDGPFDHIAIDNAVAAKEAVLHLASAGRRRIAALGAQRGAPGAVARQRLAGYRHALAQLGVEWDPSLVAYVRNFHRSDGAEAMAQLLRLPRPPDAVFAFNDLLALGALHACARQGVRVPDDVALVGCDDIEETRFSQPPLSSIAPDKAAIADEAVDALVRRMSDPGAAPREIVVGHSLAVRASSTSAVTPASPDDSGPSRPSAPPGDARSRAGGPERRRSGRDRPSASARR